MAHFAQLDENNVVTQVIVVANAELVTPEGESEAKGVEFCQSLFGVDTNWKQTSYNRKFRKNYAGIGFTYRADLDAFVPVKPFPSWLLNEETAQWYAPVPYPDDGKMYHWDQPTLSWIEVTPT